MKRVLSCALSLCFVFGLLFAPGAAASQKDAKALVEKAAAFVKANGKDAALKEFSKAKGQFDKGELYVFAYDMNATIVAHPKNPKLIGKNLLDVPDTDGKFFRKEIMETARTKGSGWVDYKYLNPETKKVEAKTTYVLKVGDLVLCCGTYK
ncbi:MAG TPA: cache domain-containing protein [Syntrophales bacterium]|nr:cache domain-containing protein [Syntrophales bacterium]HNS54782.1 cache domain-containing protein [Syntrophales bacterium]